MDAIKKFLAAHNITTHSIVVFTIAAVTAYHQVPAFHDYVYHFYTTLPAGLKNLLEALIAVVAWYWKGRTVWTPEQRAENLPPKQ